MLKKRVPCLIVSFLIGQSLLPIALSEDRLSTTPVSGSHIPHVVKTIEGLDNAISLVFEDAEEIDEARLRIYFLTSGDESREAQSGAILMLEGIHFYSYPENAEGWTWKAGTPPVIQRKNGKLFITLTHPRFAKKFSYFIEQTGSDWSIQTRWPVQGTQSIDPQKLEGWAPDYDKQKVDMRPLLDAGPQSLSVSLNGGPDLSGWEQPTAKEDFSEARPLLQALNLPNHAKIQAAIQDAISGEAVRLVPQMAWEKQGSYAWKGTALGIDWILLANHGADNGLELTGWFKAPDVRVLRIEAGLGLELKGWKWADDMENSRRIESDGTVYGNFASGRYGLDGRQSFYPFAVVERGGQALVLETDPNEPRVFELIAGSNYLHAAYAIALTQETTKFPGQGSFRASFYNIRTRENDGFRSALAGLFERFPDYTERRVPASGLWMPFSDISKLPHPEDFGFSFFEKVGNIGDDVEYAESKGILTLMYSEPWLYWLPFDDSEDRTPARAYEKMSQLAALGSGWSRDLASSGMAGAARDADGAILTKFMDLPWNKGARMEVNSDPDLASAAPGGLNRAAAEWKRISEWLDDPGIDGIYLDSMDAIVQPDHAPTAMHATDYPVTYTRSGLVPVVAPNIPQYEFTASLGALLRSKGKYLMANFPLVDAPFIHRWIDIPGEETNWWSGGQYNPPATAILDYRRALSGGKPFGFLQSTDFASFHGEPLKRYFETCLLYGFLPSFFSHNAADNPYWHNHAYLERDRPLFKTYLPLIRRIADAGWQPVRTPTLPEASGLRMEQFGTPESGQWHLTLQNQSGSRMDAELHFPDEIGTFIWMEPLSGRRGLVSGGQSLPLRLGQREVVLIDLITPDSLSEAKVFLENWRSGAGEADRARAALTSLIQERAIGLQTHLYPIGTVIRGEPSTWGLDLKNTSNETLEIRLPDQEARELLPDAEESFHLTLEATEEATHMIEWQVRQSDGNVQSFSRKVRPRAVPPIEANGPGSRVLAREEIAQVPVSLKNHTKTALSARLSWGESEQIIKLSPGGKEIIELEVPQPAEGGALTLPLKLYLGEKLLWESECRIVFLDSHNSLATAPGVKVTTDSTFGGYSTAALHDGIIDGSNLAWNEAAWASEDGPEEHWVRITFPAPQTVEEVTIHWQQEGGVTYTGRDGLLLGEVVTGQELVTANWKSEPGDAETRITFPRQTFKSLRVIQNPNRGVPVRPGILWLREVQVN